MISFKDYRSYSRGHELKLDRSKLTDEEYETFSIKDYNTKFGLPEYVYVDNGEPISEHRPCAKCGSCMATNEPDACLGHIEEVTGACCGHGIDKRRYVNFLNSKGETMHFREKLYDEFMELKSVKKTKEKYNL